MKTSDPRGAWIFLTTAISTDCRGLLQVKTRMLPYCTADTTAEVAARLSVAQLLDRSYCPPWWVASQQVPVAVEPTIN